MSERRRSARNVGFNSVRVSARNTTTSERLHLLVAVACLIAACCALAAIALRPEVKRPRSQSPIAYAAAGHESNVRADRCQAAEQAD